MSNITSIQTLQTVTREEMNRCERITDCNSKKDFFLVQSENYDANGLEYRVEAIQVNGKYHIVCGCPAGKSGTPCKHRRWVMAKVKAEKAAQSSSLIVDGQPADSETLARIEKANATAKVDRSARAPKSKPFSLLR